MYVTYLDVLKSSQKHLINVRAGPQNQTYLCVIKKALLGYQYCNHIVGMTIGTLTQYWHNELEDSMACKSHVQPIKSKI